MKSNRYTLIATALVISVFMFEHYFIAPRTEAVKESVQTQYNALRKDSLYISGAENTNEDMNSILNDMKNIEKRLIQEKTEFLASAKIQGDVTDTARKAGLLLLTIRPLSAVKNGNYTTLPVYFEGSGNIKQVSEFLKNVESGKLLLKVDKLNLNITNVQNPKDLKFKIQVSGLAKL